MSWKPAAKASRDRQDRTWVKEVVRRIQQGEAQEEDAERLYREYRPFLLQWLMRRCLQADAEDLVHKAMLRVYLGIAGFRSESSFDTWVLHIVKNVWIDHVVKTSAASTVSLEEALKPGDEDSPIFPEPVAP